MAISQGGVIEADRFFGGVHGEKVSWIFSNRVAAAMFSVAFYDIRECVSGMGGTRILRMMEENRVCREVVRENVRNDDDGGAGGDESLLEQFFGDTLDRFFNA